MKNKNAYFVSLGCPKNLVDSEIMLAKLSEQGVRICENPEEAHYIIVNTCSFIHDAKEESVQTILELADFKDPEIGKCELLVMTGCLPQRYAGDVAEELPEVDLFIGTGDYVKIIEHIENYLQDRSATHRVQTAGLKNFQLTSQERMLTTPSYMAWLKVAEGCNRRCAFCIIPDLRGPVRSRPIDSLVQEARQLAQQGVRELNLVAQDLTQYGSDLKSKDDLVALLTALDQIEELEWIRLLYIYPDQIDTRLIQVIKNAKRVLPYFDMPIQHFSNRILQSMNRKITKEQIYALIDQMRAELPDLVLRTSLIVGFPGETQEDFEELLEGMERIRFHHVGVFQYSDEEGTVSYTLDDKVEEAIVQERFEEAYQLQQDISRELNEKLVGRRLQVLVEGPHEESDLLLQGRYYGQAPEIDGQVILNQGSACPGDLVTVEIEEAHIYDVVGRIVDPIEQEIEADIEGQ